MTVRSDDSGQDSEPEEGILAGAEAAGGAVSRRGVVAGALSGAGAILAGMAAPARAGIVVGRKSAKRAQKPAIKTYWIQADSFLHNLVPNGYDSMMGTAYTADQTSYIAVGYRAYTPNWGEPLPGNSVLGPNTGIPGPVIRAEVGQAVQIHFRNNDTYYGFPHSIHSHGFVYDWQNDGAWTGLLPDKPGTAVKVGESFRYQYYAAESSVGTWPYHDHSVPQSIGDAAPDPELGAMLGMMGVAIITDTNTTVPNREIVLVIHDIYQANVPGLVQDFDCFNGYSFVENTPVFKARLGELVRWRIASFGKEFHAFHLHGHRWTYNGRNDDTILMGPATTLTFDLVENNHGTWLYHCHVTDHMMGGMMGRYAVTE